MTPGSLSEGNRTRRYVAFRTGRRPDDGVARSYILALFEPDNGDAELGRNTSGSWPAQEQGLGGVQAP